MTKSLIAANLEQEEPVSSSDTIVECVFDFTPRDPSNTFEMPIRVGEKMKIYEKGNDGWWGGMKLKDPSKRGLFPEAYVKVIQGS